MKKILLYILLSSKICFAQNNSIITENVEYQYCAGAEVLVKFKANGTFNSGNNFIVEISDKTGQNFTKIGSTTQNSITVKLPITLKEGDYYQIRVNSTNPSTNGIPNKSFRVFNTPVATIKFDGSTPVNPYSETSYSIKFEGGGSYNFKLNDSTSYKDFYPNSYQENVYRFLVYPEKTTTYKIASISNICGVGVGLGEAQIKVNSTGLLILGTEDLYYACSEQKITLAYSVNGTFNPNNTFKLLLTQSQLKYEQIIEVKMNEKGFLEGILPKDLKSNNSYSYQLISSSPELYSDIKSFNVQTKASGTVRVGTRQYSADPAINVTAYGGVPPYTLTLGNEISHTMNNNSMDIPLNDFIGKTYKVTLKDQCGNIPIENDSLKIVVPTFISIDSLPARNYCVGETMEVAISTNLNINQNTKFFLRLYASNDGFGNNQTVVLSTTKKGNILSAIIPNIGGDYYSVAVYAQSPNLESNKYNGRRIKINQVGSAGLSIDEDYLGNKILNLNLNNGLEPTYIKMKINNDEQILHYRDFDLQEAQPYYKIYRMNINTQKTQTFSLNEVKNECGSFQIKPTAKTVTNTVAKPQSRHLFIGTFSKNTYCKGEEVSIPFTLEGTLKEGEVVELYWYSEGGYDVKVSQTTKSPLKFILNESYRNVTQAYLKISNSDIKSDVRGIYIQDKANIWLNVYLAEGNKIQKNQPIEVRISHSGSFPMSYLLNGKKRVIEKDYYADNYNLNEKLFLYPNQSTTFSIASVSNACGVGINQTPNDVNIETVTTTLFFSEYTAPIASGKCGGQYLRIPYKAYNITKDTQIIAELSDNSGKNFKELTTIQSGSPLIVLIPKDLQYGRNYQLRLVAKNAGGDTYSEAKPFIIYQEATAKLSTIEGKNIIEKSLGQNLELKAEFTGSPNWSIKVANHKFGNSFYDGGSYYESPGKFTINPDKKTIYSIAQLSNQCGFGKSQGDVLVSVKPYISPITVSSNQVCYGQKVNINLSLKGDYAPNDVVIIKLVKNDNSTIKEITRFKAQDYKPIEFSPAKDFDIGNYYIGTEFENSPQSAIIDYNSRIEIKSPPTLNISGNSIINNGGATYINMNVIGSLPITYELSDGSIGSIQNVGLQKIQVKPTNNIVYSIKSASNFCGNAIIAGTAQITVNPSSTKTIETFAPNQVSFCANSNVSVSFNANGSFSSSNKFLLQISDANGDNFKTINSTEYTQSPINSKIPENLATGDNYRFRVIATDANVSSSASTSSFRLFEPATVKVSGQNYFESNKPITIKLDLTGADPWSVTITDSLTNNYISSKYITTSPANISLQPTKPITYKFVSFNDCGAAKFIGSNFLKVELLTAEEPTVEDFVKVFPNPVSEFLIINLPKNNQHTECYLLSADGKEIFRKTIELTDYQLDMKPFSTGKYLIILEFKGKKKVYQVMKD